MWSGPSGGVSTLVLASCAFASICRQTWSNRRQHSAIFMEMLVLTPTLLRECDLVKDDA